MKIKNTTLITQYRSCGNEDRKRNLRKFLQYYNNLFENIIVVEQDLMQSISLGNMAQYVFTYNSGVFNRSWGFNVGAMEVLKNNKPEIFFFCDVDVLVEKNAIEKSIEAIQNSNKTSANPYSYIERLNTNILSDNVSFNLCTGNSSSIPSYAGGALLMTRQLFLEIKGWNEEFRGWGGEDNAMLFVLRNRNKNEMHEQNGRAIHLHHHPDFKGQRKMKHKYYNNNLEVGSKISQTDIVEYIAQRKNIIIGDKIKYIGEENES